MESSGKIGIMFLAEGISGAESKKGFRRKPEALLCIYGVFEKLSYKK
jgi:hypothetical protein